MRIDYTDHSLERLEEREISIQEIEEAIQYGKVENAVGESQKSVHKIKKGTLIVVL